MFEEVKIEVNVLLDHLPAAGSVLIPDLPGVPL
jgi:hypothetical protein